MDKFIEANLKAVLQREGLEPKPAIWSSSAKSSSSIWEI